MQNTRAALYQHATTERDEAITAATGRTSPRNSWHDRTRGFKSGARAWWRPSESVPPAGWPAVIRLGWCGPSEMVQRCCCPVCCLRALLPVLAPSFSQLPSLGPWPWCQGSRSDRAAAWP